MYTVLSSADVTERHEAGAARPHHGVLIAEHGG